MSSISVNFVIIGGNLTRDPQVRTLPSGTKVADLGVAVSEQYKDKTGDMKENTHFIDVAAWARTAELCEQYLRKGSPVLVEGRLQFEQWDSKDGEKRSKLKVRAQRVIFLGEPAGRKPPPTATTTAGSGEDDFGAADAPGDSL